MRRLTLEPVDIVASPYGPCLSPLRTAIDLSARARHPWQIGAVDQLLRVRPDFMSVTYGAGGKDRSNARATVRRLVRDTGQTTLLVTHDAIDALTLADRVVVMDQGRVVDQGTHGELLGRGGIYAGLYRLQFQEGAQ